MLRKRSQYRLFALLSLVLLCSHLCASCVGETSPSSDTEKYGERSVAEPRNPGEPVSTAPSRKLSDDPTDVWEEWDESEHSRKVPRRQRQIEPGMNIRTVMGMVMKQQKTFWSFVAPAFISSGMEGQKLISRFRSKLLAGGVHCKMWFAPNSPQLMITTESVLDAHNAKDFLLRQPEIERVVLDNVPFTPGPNLIHEDDDSDEL